MTQSEPRKTLASHARKSLGQHFLINTGICDRIVSLLNIRSSDNILEIGPGPGALSNVIRKHEFNRLILIEKDPRWASLQNTDISSICVLNMDALDFAWQNLSGSWKLIGNLPYNAASPLIWDIVSRVPDLVLAVFMVQLEVARRITASPGNRDYGALSVWVQNYTRPKMEIKVGPGSFRPPPKVDSGVVSFIPLAKDSWPGEPEKLKTLLKICFQNRRKQLGGIFALHKMGYMLDALESLNIAPSLRPENLSPEVFRRLASFIGN